ncbi:MAG: RpiB/LacA/LacB family sugar-phosphate isomerase [Chloroflexi bacterium]|nr:MAG: RpiB/LacA/LacB family sugar-phosphate isomerase [Chloroflexota bacterium]
MRMAIGSDERTHVTDVVVAHLRGIGIDVELHGPLNDRPMDWVDVGREVGQRVASGACQQGVLFCWTGTGVSIAANKVPGIRAALCADAETAKGARRWNDANVLVMSLRATPEAVAKEICDAWLETSSDEAERETIAKVESPHPALPQRGRDKESPALTERGRES